MSNTSAGHSDSSESPIAQLWVKDTAGNLSPVSSIAEVSEAQFLEFERGIATRLGNAERLQRCQSLKYFPAAQTEWLQAVHLVCKQYHFGAVSASGKPTLGELKDYVLEGLRFTDTPDLILRNMADVPKAVLGQIVCHAFGQKDMASIPAIHHALGNVHSSTGHV